MFLNLFSLSRDCWLQAHLTLLFLFSPWKSDFSGLSYISKSGDMAALFSLLFVHFICLCRTWFLWIGVVGSFSISSNTFCFSEALLFWLRVSLLSSPSRRWFSNLSFQGLLWSLLCILPLSKHRLSYILQRFVQIQYASPCESFLTPLSSLCLSVYIWICKCVCDVPASLHSAQCCVTRAERGHRRWREAEQIAKDKLWPVERPLCDPNGQAV